MQDARALDGMAAALVQTAMQLVDSDHAAYNELDAYLGRGLVLTSDAHLKEWVERRVEDWNRLFPTHPILGFMQENPDAGAVRLSDVTSMPGYYNSALYTDLFVEMDVKHQAVLHLGLDPSSGPASGAPPSAIGMSITRSGSDFSDRDIQVLELLQKLAIPVVRRKRFEHQFRLLEDAQLTQETLLCLMRLGLSSRQAEVAFWMLKGKSNSVIGMILDISAATVRQHSMAIFRKLGEHGRLALQKAVFQSIAGLN
ncbi:MAG: helix-turn-helix transcriptional regulator [Novosphingobium sp.]|nr:hypothetical protein [Novosphingobium sp.]